jgi:Gram-negative bacterial TonB protein C-terminal
MHALRWLGLLLVALSSAAAAATPGAAATDLWLSARISIDPQGQVTDLVWNNRTPLHKLIAENINAKVRAWEFVPATVGGRPAATQTGLVIHLRAEDQPDGAITVRVLGAKTGPMTVETPPPSYPMTAAAADVSAKVVVEVSVAADGSAVVHDMRFSGSGGKSYRKEFLAASQDALKAWSFYPEVVNGQSVPTVVTVPVMFCMEPSAWCSRQRRQDEMAKKEELPANFYMATESAVALKTDIQDAAL